MKAKKVNENINNILKPKSSAEIKSNMNPLELLNINLINECKKYWENIGIEFGKEYTREELDSLFEKYDFGWKYNPWYEKNTLYSEGKKYKSSIYIPEYVTLYDKEILITCVYGKIFTDNWNNDRLLFNQRINLSPSSFYQKKI